MASASITATNVDKQWSTLIRQGLRRRYTIERRRLVAERRSSSVMSSKRDEMDDWSVIWDSTRSARNRRRPGGDATDRDIDGDTGHLPLQITIITSPSAPSITTPLSSQLHPQIQYKNEDANKK